MTKLIRYFIVASFFVLLQLVAFSQFDQVDQVVANYPTEFDSYQGLSNQIKLDFKNDMDRARAAFAWIAMNVKYKTKGITNMQKIRFSYTSKEDLKEQQIRFRKELAQKTITSKQALCEGYATLYQEVCRLMNINCVIIPGTAKRFISDIRNRNLPSNHAWNAISINNEWKLVDVTWAAGFVDYARMKFIKEYTPGYFNCSLQEFAMKHFPDDGKWLLLPYHFSKEQFLQQPSVFNDFIGHNYQLLAPTMGLLSVRKGEKIHFAFRNIPAKVQIAYHFKQDKFGQIVKAIRVKDRTSFSVPASKKGNDELLIFFDSKAVLGYKVSIK